MTQSLNQFSQTPQLGMLDAQSRGGTILSAQVSDNIGAGVTLSAGQPVKLDTTINGGVPQVLPLAADSDEAFGTVVYVLKDQSYGSGDRLEIALNGTIQFLQANAAVTRGAPVEVDITTAGNVAPSGGVNPILGRAVDGCGAAGLIRVLLNTLPAQVAGVARTVTVTATLAQINAGLVIVPAVAGKAITVSNFIARVTGNFATATAVVLESTNASPVVVTSEAIADVTDGAILNPNTAGTTLGAGFGHALGSGDGLQIAKTGTAATGGTSIEVTVTFVQE